MHILLFYTSTFIFMYNWSQNSQCKIYFFNSRSVFCLNTDGASIVCLPEYTCACLVAQLCLILCDPMDSSPPDSSDHGIFQARILEWVTIPFSRESSQLRNQTQVPCIAGGFFTIWATRQAQIYIGTTNKMLRSHQLSSLNTFLYSLYHWISS